MFSGKYILVLTAAVLLALPVRGADARQKSLKGHVPSVVRHLAPSGRVPATNTVHLAIGLPFHDAAGLDQFLAQAYDPASPNFRHFLTPDELTRRFGPTEQEYEAVKNFARTNGLTITAQHGSRLLLDVHGPAGAVERAFHVTLRTYHHPFEARDFVAPDTEPSVDASLPIADVSGLESFSRPYPKVRRSRAPSPDSGSAPDGSYLGSDFRNAYVPGTSLDGTGQSVGLVQFEGFYANDIATYASLAGGGRANIAIVPVTLDQFSGTPDSTDVNGIAEVSLDIEMAMSMAPGLTQIVVFEGNQAPGLFIPDDVLDAMAASNTIKNLSSSWSWSGGPSTTTDNIFKKMAAQGQSYFNASGDSDAFLPGYADNSANTTTPGTGPYVTDVGGTTLSTTGPGGSYVGERVWNWGYDVNAGAYVGSSGGVSYSYPAPAWQQGVNSFLNNGGSITGRNIPDVALTGDGVYVVYDNNNSTSAGGTSCAAPLWAGFMALVNQEAAAISKPSVGFINPAVYELANETIYSSVFHDITVGDNTSASSPNAFYAVPGYDLCTGVGTPGGTDLINALVNPDSLVVVSNGGFTAISQPSGAFNITSGIYALTNASAFPLSWSMVNTCAWLSISATNGTLAAGAGAAVVVSLNTAATNLGAGTYTANLWFSNVTSSVGHSRFFVLQAVDPLGISPTNSLSYFGFPGGPAYPTTQTLTLTNGRGSPISWSLANTSAWLVVSNPAGTLAVGTHTNITVALTATATNLPLGTYTASLLVTDLTSQAVQVITNTLLIAQSLVQNGGFETGDFTDWTLVGDGSPYNLVDDGSLVTSIAPHSGTYFAALGESGVLATLSQSLLTIPGQKYLLSLWLESPNYNPYTPNQFQLLWNGTRLYNQINIAPAGWVNLQYAVTATGASTMLQIAARDDNYYLGLDDVAVTPGYSPTVTIQPTNVIAQVGSNIVLTATASGTPTLTYRWTRYGTNLIDGGSISGSSTSTLSLANAGANLSGNYAVVVANLFGSVTSSVATLAFIVPATIASSSITNQIVQCGSNNVTFVVTAAGTAPFAYQWKWDGIPIPNATNTSYSVTNVHLPSHGIGITVSNLYGGVSSNTILTVRDTLAPAVALLGSSQMTIELGSAFVDPGATATDLCAGAVGVIVSGAVNSNTVSTNTLTYRAGDGNGNTNSAVRTVFVRDTTPPTVVWSFTNLVIAADSNCVAAMPNATGTNYIIATDLSGVVTISQTPTNGTVLLPGTNQVVLAVADASSNVVYSTNFLVVRDLTPPVITLNGANPLFVEFGRAFVDPGATALDNCSGPEPVAVAGLVNTNLVGTNSLTYTASDASGNTNAITRTVIVRDTTPPTVVWSFTNLLLAANSNCIALAPDVTGTNFIVASDASGVAVISQMPTNQSMLALGTNQLVITVADAYGNSSYSTNSIIVMDETPPVIVLQPLSETNGLGANASFMVGATACTALGYQWFAGSTLLATQTNSLLTISNLTLAAAGKYSVLVSASGGSVTSSVVTLTVYALPLISAVAANTNGLVTLSLTGSPGYSYILQAATNLADPVWLAIATNTLNTNGLWLFTDLQSTNLSGQFYRLMLGQ
jgi:hypothetical protein